MDAPHAPRSLRSREFLDTVALGSLLVFASVMPPLPSNAAVSEDHAGSSHPAARPECPEPRAS